MRDGVWVEEAVAVGVFVLAIAFNFVCARGIQYVARAEAIKAANTDLLLGVIAYVSFWLFVNVGWWVAAPELFGGWLGTFYGTVRKK